MSSLMNFTPQERAELQLPHLVALAEKVCWAGLSFVGRVMVCKRRSFTQPQGMDIHTFKLLGVVPSGTHL